MRERNIKLDILRGIAALIVVLGHAIQLFDAHDKSVLYNIIFSIQMPLFMLISGFSVVFSKQITDFTTYKNALKKKSLMLLLPWFVWSVLYYVLLGNLPLIEHIQATAFHMEDAYWFLFSLWTIQLIFLTSQFLARKIKGELLNKIFVILFCGFACLILLIIGKVVGITFLGIKYTCFYIPFFVLGWCIALLNSRGFFSKHNKIIRLVEVICVFIYCVLISKYKVFQMPDASFYILIRIFISLLGCFIITQIVRNVSIKSDGNIKCFMLYAGNHSLELYVVHFLVLRYISCKNINLLSIDGWFCCIGCFAIVLIISLGIIWAINCNPYMNLICFGKKTKKQ